MDKRRLIKSGQGSFVVSLPIEFVRRNSLKKGSQIFVIDKGHEVTISPEGKDVPVNKNAVIECQNKNTAEIKNMITSNYLLGASSLLLRRLPPNERETVINFITILPGFQIVSEEYDKIEINDVLDVQKVNVTQYLKRTDMMIRSLFLLVLDSIRAKQKIDFITRGRIQGNCFFILKILNKVLKNTSVAEKIGIEVDSIVHLSRAVIELENISDHLDSIGDDNSPKTRLAKIVDIIHTLKDSYETSINAFYKKDSKSAESVFINKDKTKKSISSVLESQDKESAIRVYDHLLDIEKSIRRISLIAYDLGNSSTTT